MKSYRAYAADGGVTASNPQQAAREFFLTFLNKRKCDVIQGESDGVFFSVRYGLSTDERPSRWKDVTKKTLLQLPGD